MTDHRLGNKFKIREASVRVERLNFIVGPEEHSPLRSRFIFDGIQLRREKSKERQSKDEENQELRQTLKEMKLRFDAKILEERLKASLEKEAQKDRIIVMHEERLKEKDDLFDRMESMYKDRIRDKDIEVKYVIILVFFLFLFTIYLLKKFC